MQVMLNFNFILVFHDTSLPNVNFVPSHSSTPMLNNHHDNGSYKLWHLVNYFILFLMFFPRRKFFVSNVVSVTSSFLPQDQTGIFCASYRMEVLLQWYLLHREDKRKFPLSFLRIWLATLSPFTLRDTAKQISQVFPFVVNDFEIAIINDFISIIVFDNK